MAHRLSISFAKLRSDPRAQDLIEFASMAGFLAVTVGTVLPGAASSISSLFSQIAAAGGNRHVEATPLHCSGRLEAKRVKRDR
jgi:hypothetical protein